MILNRRTFLTAAGLSALAGRQIFAAPAADGEDWPCHRGPRRDGTWTETGIVEKFAAPEIPAKWKTPVSNGYISADADVVRDDLRTLPQSQ